MFMNNLEQQKFRKNHHKNNFEMKASNFRIRDRIVPKNKIEALHQSYQSNSRQQSGNDKFHSQNEDKFTTLIESFQTIINSLIASNLQIKHNSNLIKNKNVNTKEYDHRDRYIILDLPDSQNGKVSQQNLEIWVGNICFEIFSVSFNYYSSGKISYDQMKVFTSQSLLRNLAILVDNFLITNEDLKFLDKKMKDDVLPYLKAKYPMTIQQDSNKALQKAIRQIDNTQALSNDFFSQTKIRFSFRQNGRYDDLIMQFLNQLMRKVDFKNQNVTNFNDFKFFMASIFQKSYDQSWIMNLQQQTQIKSQQQKVKYKQKVQQYTNLAIGRKIPENTELFTEDQIKSGFLRIKNASILRILTKWCEQLWEKFENQNYFIQRTQGLLFVENEEIGTVNLSTKKYLQEWTKRHKQAILEDMKKIQEINYDQNIQLMKGELQNKKQLHIQKYQKSAGKFACKVVKNIQNFIINYLNRLIHGLTSVSKDCFPDYSHKNKDFLLSFTIGDLMRCKYSSKQRQVLRIFQQIERISNKNPEKMKIVRIKNRLKMGTNDILLNVKFNDSLVCQIQLAINSTKNDFIKCSYNFNHYIYQLERTLFGPIAQACSTWKNLEKRSKQFEKLIERQNKNIKINKLISNSNCIQQDKIHDLNQQQKPFICSQCSKHYSHNNFMCNHLSCNVCRYWKCAVCLIEQNRKAQNLKFFLNQMQLKQHCKFWQGPEDLPAYGLCILIQKASAEIIAFKNLNYNQKQYLFCKTDGQIMLMKQLKTKRQIQNFIKKRLLFQIDSSSIQSSFQLTDKQLIAKFIIPNYIESCFKQQKQVISILGQVSLLHLDTGFFNKHGQTMLNIKFLEFSQCKLPNLKLIMSQFTNLNRLNLCKNQIQDFSSLIKFKKLERLYLSQNKINSISENIQKLQNLKELDLSINQIQCIPQNFACLKSLTTFVITHNKLKTIPENFCQLQNLKTFNAFQNNFQEFPIALGKHRQLEIINLENNQIQAMPIKIQDLRSLIDLNLSSNKIFKLPQQMKIMLKLEKINLSSNKSQEKTIYLGGISDCKNLKQIILSKNNLEYIQFPLQLQSLQSLQIVDLGNNKLSQFDGSLRKLKFVKKLILEKNNFSVFDLEWINLQYLEILNAFSNKISQIPKQIQKLKNIKQIDFSSNGIFNLTNQQIKFSNIQKIAFNSNNLIQIPAFSMNQATLKELTIISNDITLIPKNIKNLVSLNFLNLSLNKIKQIPDEIGKLSNLVKLDLNSNNIKRINPCIFELSNLKCLILSNNQIQIVENEEKFFSLKKFKTFELMLNPLRKYPMILKNIKRISSIIDQSSIQSIPIEYFSKKIQNKIIFKGECLEQITFKNVPKWIQTIEQVELEFNHFKIFPEIVFEAMNLKKINLKKNKIESLPDQFDRVLKLEKLLLACNKIKSLPQSITKLLNLKWLGVSNNQISEIPESIENLTNLIYLEISFNKLTALPITLGKLENLIQLSAQFNQQIKVIPSEIGELKNIEILGLEGNKIQQIPLTICRNTSIRQLTLNSNQIQIIPNQIINMTGLENGKLTLSENPLNQIAQYDFVYSKGNTQTKNYLKIWKKETQQQAK